MLLRSIARAGICAAFALSCQGKVRQGGSEGAADGDATPRPTRRMPAVRCTRSSNPEATLPDGLRRELSGHAERIERALRGGTGLPVWNMLAASVRDESRKEVFLRNLDTLAARIRRAGPGKVEEIVHLEVAPQVQGRMQVSCPGPDGTWTVRTRVDGADLAIVYTVHEGGPLPPRVVHRLRRGDDGWEVLGLESTAHRFRGADATAHRARAEAALAAGRPIEALLEAGIAQVLAMRGRGVVTPESDAVARMLADGKLERGAVAELARTLGLPAERIVSVGLFNTEFDLAPRVRYVTAVDDVRDEAAVRKEATELARKLTAKVPGLTEAFDTVLFEALPERPTDSSAPIEAARVAVQIGPPAQGRPIEENSAAAPSP
ncbi:MAG: hypothetical protein D6705_07230 [Deltaproteobacteria bacterium]|nr:MAG: hypothetical protein D6705_07230 [Deltaproteobacteria bacterium]